MDNIAKITDAIRNEAKASSDEILKNAATEAEDLKKLYRRQAELAAEEILAKAEKKVSAIQQKGVSQVGIEARNIRLAARRDALEQCFDETLERLVSLPAEDKAKMYSSFISQCSTSDEVKVRLNEKDSAEVGPMLKVEGKSITVLPEAGKFTGGVVIIENEVETNCTFELLVGKTKEDMESEIAGMLFA